MDFIKNISLTDPMTIHLIAMVLAGIPMLYLIYNTVKLGRTSVQSVFATVYVAALIALYIFIMLVVQLILIPKLS